MTLYRLATSAQDYRKCHALLKAEGLSYKLSFPTVMADRDGDIVGFLSTAPRKDAVIAGPLFIRGDMRGQGFLTLRLGEAYENVMRAAGIREYLAVVDPGNERWTEALDAAGLEPMGEHDGRLWFKRRLSVAA